MIPRIFLFPLLLPTFLILPAFSQVVISEFMADNESIVVPNSIAGSFDDWIELQNTGATAVDLGGWGLTDDPDDPFAWRFPAGTSLPANGFLVIFASGDGSPDANGNLHTNFKLSGSGEYVGLINPDSTVASEFGPMGTDFPSQTENDSYGLHPVSGETVFFADPTPGAANDPDGVARVEPVEVTPKRGYYQSVQSITISTPTPDARIYYTTDGSDPLTSSGNPSGNATEFTEAFEVDQITVVRAAAIRTNYEPSPLQSHSYFILGIDNAAANGSDPDGFNEPFLSQRQPAGYRNLSSGDYNMDTDISKRATASAGHPGQSVAQAMLEGMREVPTISISLPANDFLDIYTRSQTQGLEERCSAEFIPAENDSRTAFHETCGLRVQGGASRIPDRSPKHALSFRFREEYGSGRLREELFPEVDLANFNSIALRAVYNNSWIHSNGGQRGRASMIRDQWMRDSMREMGHPDAGAGFLAHVFVNGLYWGLHNLAERQDNAHYANYHGGDSELIDARNGSKFVEGTSTAWSRMQAVVRTKNWDDIQQVLDVDTFIDFHLLQRFGGNQDLKTDGNWRAAGGGPFNDPTEMRPWKIYCWDSERILESANERIVPLDPMGIRNTLESMPEYRLRFATRAQAHLTGDGALTPEKCRARWERRAQALDKAIIAESARWGDHRVANNPYDRDDWLREQTRLYDTYFPTRTDFVIGQLQSSNLFPEVETPVFAAGGLPSEGGYLSPGSLLSINGDNGIIYYTLDGTDPALEDGSVNPNALSQPSGVVTADLFGLESENWQYLDTGVAQSDSSVVVGNASYDSNDWKHPDFDDSAWGTGQGLLGGRRTTSVAAADANTIVNIGPLGASFPTVYFRREFSVLNPQEVTSMELSLICDDGGIVYLNGREVYRVNVGNGTVAFGFYTGNNGDEDTIYTAAFPVLPGELKASGNVISVEVHNTSQGSSDLGMDLGLAATRPVGSTTIELTSSSNITARLLANGDWSAPVSALFFLEQPASSSNLTVGEIHYHPREATLLEKVTAAPLDLNDRDLFEFVELINTGSEPLNLAGAQFTDGIDLKLGFKILDPGDRALIVRDEAAFLSRYGQDLADSIAGIYQGALKNGGELLQLSDFGGSIIAPIDYNDSGSWPSRADGAGSSLEFRNASGSVSSPQNWAPSVAYDGSPGVEGALQDQRIVINEVATNSMTDFIELHNSTATEWNIEGWVLSDSKKVYRSFTLPDVSIPPLGYQTFDSTSFNAAATKSISGYNGVSGASPTTVTAPAHGLQTGDLVTIVGYGGFSEFNDSFEVTVVDANQFLIEVSFLDDNPTKGSWQKGRSFGLGARSGDSLWLIETDENGKLLNFVDQVEFAGAAPSTTLGRWPDGMGNNSLMTMTSVTKGAENSGPVIGLVTISELHYADPESEDFTYVELHNPTGNSISLDGWRLRGGLDFDFGSTHSIAAGTTMILVPFGPATESAKVSAFKTHYSLANDITLVGPTTDGPLRSDTGTVRLQKLGADPGLESITIDEVQYLSTSPWPSASANGRSLQRLQPAAFGNFASSWFSASPSPGSFVDPPNTFSAWADSFGVSGANGDADGDSFENLLEYALGTDPTSFDSFPLMKGDSGSLLLEFGIRTDRAGVAVTVESSNDLVTWEAVEITPTTAEGVVQNYEASFDPSANKKQFLRFRATGSAN